MSNNKIVVVGSGIAGITAAYFEAKKGNTVTLIDSDERAGGLLKSDLLDGVYFDYGTHIMSETGIEDLDNFLFSKLNNDNCLIERQISAANYFNSTMNCKNGYVNSQAIGENLYKKGCSELLEKNKIPKGKNLEEVLLQKFGVTFYEHIYRPLIKKYIGVDCKLLAAQVGSFFDMSRLLAFDENLTKEMCKSDIYNEKLGHHKREDGVVKYYPRAGGIGKIVELLIKELKQKKVDIKLATNIRKIQRDNGKITAIVTDNEIIKTDKLIWTLPSSYLAFLSGLDKKSPPPEFRNTGLYDFTFESPLNSEACYINIYDLDMYSGRVTLYQNLSKSDNYSCTVEVLADKTIKLEDLIDDIKSELVKMGIVDKGNKCTFKKFRPIKNGFPILTTEFVKKQVELGEYCEIFFENVLFVGRSTGRVFFMRDVLIDTFNKVNNDRDK